MSDNDSYDSMCDLVESWAMLDKHVLSKGVFLAGLVDME